MELVAVEMTSTPLVEQNFQTLEAILQQFCDVREDDDALVLLPESFALFGGSARLNLDNMEVLGQGPISAAMAALAQKYQVWLGGGTIPTRCSDPDKFQATLAVFNPEGELVGDYQKIHLFDVDVADKTRQYRESDFTKPGEKVVSLDIQGVTVGLSVCYDVRFSGLFSQLASEGAQVLLVPSAFTVPTGQAHWHHLLAARAIENQAYVLAAGQVGVHANGRETYGHSMLIDPWGTVVAQYDGHSPGFIRGRFDLELLEQIRSKMPVAQHNRFSSRCCY